MHQEVLTNEAGKLLPQLKFFNEFYLAGGTALALQIGHRISVDFDFFSAKELKKDLLSEIEKFFGGANNIKTKEIAAMKAYTIGRRGAFKDYVDLYFILLDNFETMRGIVENAEKKYGDAFNSRLFLEQLVYFEDIKDTDIRFLRERVSVDELRSFFEERAREIRI